MTSDRRAGATMVAMGGAAYVALLGLTIAIEVPLATWVLAGDPPLARRQWAIAAALAQLLTHPIFVLAWLRAVPGLPGLLLGELAVFGAEAAFYRWRGAAARVAVHASALANAASCAAGIAIALLSRL
jgi:hypothetical protein